MLSSISRHRQLFFDITIHNQKVKDCISGKNEEKVINLLERVGYKLNTDFVRQHPIRNTFVIDIAFIKEQLAIEVDGEDHKYQRKQDKKRDKFFYDNNWVVIRVDDKIFFKNALFYKYLIEDIVNTRREQYEEGKLYKLDILEFNDENYVD